VVAFWEQFPVIETERLILRELRVDDDRALYPMFADAEMMRYWGTPHDSLARTTVMVTSIIDAYRAQTGIEWAVTRKPTGEVIGKVCHHRWMKEHFRSEMGYILAKEHWGHGFVHEALRAIIAFGFAVMKLHSIEAQLDPKNVRSVRVLEKLGFVKEAHLTENYFVHGGFVDTAIYSLLARTTAD
jgi:ribosomal-protein-alanine N-acetyltransferase